MTMQKTFKKGDFSRDLPFVPEKWQDLPESSIAYLVAYGWKQSHSDAYAGAKDEAEFEAKLFKRNDALKAGTMALNDGTGRASPTRDPVEKEFRALVAEKLKAWVAKRTAEKGKPSEDLQQVWLDMFLEKNEEALRATAVENVKRRAAMVIEEVDVDLPEEEEDEAPAEAPAPGTPTFE